MRGKDGGACLRSLRHKTLVGCCQPPWLLRRKDATCLIYSSWRLRGGASSSSSSSYSSSASTPWEAPPANAQVVCLDSLPEKVPFHLRQRNEVDKVNSTAIGRHVQSGRLRLDWTDGPPRTVLFVKKQHSLEATKALDRVAQWMTKEFGCRALVEPVTTKELPHWPTYDPSQAEQLSRVVDFVVTLGGDGTILHTSSLFQTEVPPVLSFSMGTLGFLLPFRIDDYKEVIQAVMKGGFSLAHRMRLACHVHTNEQNNSNAKSTKTSTLENEQTTPTRIATFHAMNDVVLQGNAARLTVIECYVNNKFLATCSGDGVMAATSTGSTAYSLSCGGSMVHPSIHSILITPISTRSFHFKPFILPDHCTIKLKLSPTSREDAIPWFDGQRRETVKKGDWVEVEASPYPILTVNRSDEIVDWVRAVRNLNRFLGDSAKRRPDF
ncbi:NADH kinase pos5 [Balamuthia mandrillaris]